MLPRRIRPPARVGTLGTSPNAIQTQTGASTTSASDSNTSSADGTCFEPRVKRKMPAPMTSIP